MGMFRRLEQRLEEATNRVFARTFRAEVQPVEIASAMRRAMDDKATSTAKGRSIVPNVYTIELSETDYERLAGWGDDLDDELIAAAEEHCESQGYTPGGPLQIRLVESPTLETGIFALRPSTARTIEDPYAVTPPPAVTSPPARPAPSPAAAARDEPEPDPEPEPPAYDDEPYEAEVSADELAPEPPVPAAVPPKPRKPKRVNPADRPWLEIDGDRYPLMGALTVLGRDDGIEIILDDPGVSRTHSEFRVTTDGPHTIVAVRDLRSTNGTFVNGERITSLHLEDGDRITVGRTSMTFHAGRR